jgi:hypothetical protein
MTTSNTLRTFLPVERAETSSKEPGCLDLEMKNTKNAIGQNPEKTR